MLLLLPLITGTTDSISIIVIPLFLFLLSRLWASKRHESWLCVSSLCPHSAIALSLWYRDLHQYPLNYIQTCILYHEAFSSKDQIKLLLKIDLAVLFFQVHILLEIKISEALKKFKGFELVWCFAFNQRFSAHSRKAYLYVTSDELEKGQGLIFPCVYKI